MVSDPSRDRFERLGDLKRAQWEMFDRRRNFEWKISLSLWTAMAAFIALVLRGDANVAVESPWPVIVIAIAVVGLHAYYIRGMAKAQGLDRTMEYELRDAMLHVIGFEFTTETRNEMTRQARWQGLVRKWGAGFQLGVTILLSSIILIALLAG